MAWHPRENFGFGLGYNLFELDVEATDEDLVGRVKYRYDGPKLSLKARF